MTLDSTKEERKEGRETAGTLVRKTAGRKEEKVMLYLGGRPN